MVLSLTRWVGKVALVTGANAGIGAAITKQLMETGIKVVGLDKTLDSMETIIAEKQNQSQLLHPLKCDMSKEEDILNAFEWVDRNLGPVSILINNAGVILDTNIVEGDTKLWKETLDINVLGTCIATRETVKRMRQNDIDGHIFNINSVGGHRAPYFSFSNVYPASKHAVTALTETTLKELDSLGLRIKITSISPGLVKTNMTIEMSHLPAVESEDVADAVMYGLSTPPYVQINELMITPVNEKYVEEVN
ncbi:unnamed protein product [Phaedon cochleariae]|uniref:Farnesol dehydrogenase-like n=1 Tax=Phaedon cochleariae TaxID=80249 RepID=A0A9P0DY07_PHACE|nr:unnamed protein product [Phaedon cochleariae]